MNATFFRTLHATLIAGALLLLPHFAHAQITPGFSLQPVNRGGTGTATGNITGTGDLTSTAASSGASLVLRQGANGGATLTPKGTGQVFLNSTSVSGALVEIRSDTTAVLSLNSIGTYGARLAFANIGSDSFGVGMPASTGDLALYASNTTERFRFKGTGAFLIGSTSDDGTNKLQVNGTIKIGTATPASAGATGVAGTIAWDANYIYVCTATNTWKRVAIATW